MSILKSISIFVISVNSTTSVSRSKSLPIRKQQKLKIKKKQSLVIPQTRTTSLADKKQNEYFEKRRRGIIKLALITCIAFEITFLPSVILWLVPRSIFKPEPYHHKFCSTISWLNSAITPIIYFSVNEQFRSEYVKLIKLVFRIKK